jgi:hypothetical protein
MFIPTARRHVLFALVFFAISAVAVACTRDATAPVARSAVSRRGVLADEDTLACLSGYVVVNGRYVCN